MVAEPSLVDCTQTMLRWTQPALDEQNGTLHSSIYVLRSPHVIHFLYSGNIRQYRVRVSGVDNPAYEETFTTSSTTQLVDGLQCCSSYRFTVSAFTISYGPAAALTMFRTNPDLSSKPLVFVLFML